MDYEIGLTAESMTALDALTTPVVQPNSSWQDYSDEVALGSGGIRGIGSPVARWNFGLLDDVAMRNQLKTFCPGQSARVYIRTRKGDGTFADFEAIMRWPLIETDENYWKLNLEIEFTHLIEL